MNKLYVILSCATALLNAADKNTSSYPAGVADKINFELINKSNESIWFIVHPIEVKSGYYVFDKKLKQENPPILYNRDIKIVEIKPGYTFGGTLEDIPGQEQKRIQIALKMNTLSRPINNITDVDREEYVFSDSFKGSVKTFFLSYDMSKKAGARLYPQTGPLKGMGKYVPDSLLEDRTNTGLSKSNNIDSKKIMYRFLSVGAY
jgi:hypothetical protein